ncbi:MAG: winged helix-turn-helix domain-containing protein [Bacteroidota bacterium]
MEKEVPKEEVARLSGWQIKDWTVYPDLHLVKNHQSEFVVKPRLMKLLTFFLLHPNEVITKEAILDYVWEDRIVTENLLTKSISELRKLLHTHLDDELEITTIRNVGYRLQTQLRVEPLGRISEQEELPASVLTIPRWALVLGLGVLVIALLLWSQGYSTSPKEYQIEIRRVSTLKGQELSPVLSPNGQNIAFAWRQHPAEPFHLYVRAKEEHHPRKLTTSVKGEFNPLWSTDGNHLLFMREEGPGLIHLIKKSVIGEDEVSLAILSDLQPHRGLIWSKDERYLFFSARQSLDQPYAIYAFDMDQLTFHRLSHPSPNDFGDLFVTRTNEDQELAFVRAQKGKTILSDKAPTNAQLMLLDLSTKVASELTYLEGEIKDLAFHPGMGQYLCWRSYALTDQDLLSIDHRGQQEVLLSAIPGMPGLGMVGADMDYYFEYWQSDLNVFQYTLSDPFTLRDTSMEYLNSTLWDWGLDFASKTEAIAFLSMRSGHQEVWLARADSPLDARQLTQLKSPLIKNLSIDPQGQKVAFLQIDKEQNNLYVVQSNGKILKKWEEAGIAYGAPHWSADGKWLYFARKKDWDWTFWQRELATDRLLPLYDLSGQTIKLDPFDSTRLYYTQQDTLYRFSTSEQKSEKLQLLSGLETTNWAINKQGIYYLAWEESYCHLRYYELETQEIHTLQKLKQAMPGLPALSLAPDGQSIYLAQPGVINADIMAITIKE